MTEHSGAWCRNVEEEIGYLFDDAGPRRTTADPPNPAEHDV